MSLPTPLTREQILREVFKVIVPRIDAIDREQVTLRQEYEATSSALSFEQVVLRAR